MKYIIVAIIGLLLLSTCTCSKDKYRKEISGIFISHWDFRPIPQRGIVYMYKKNTHFTEFIDTVNFSNYSAITNIYSACQFIKP